MYASVDIALTMGFAWMISGLCLLILKKRETESGKLGIVLLVVMGLSLADNLSDLRVYSLGSVQWIYLISRNSYFLIGPFLWLYAKYLTGSKGIKPYIFVLHLLPFFIAVIFMVFNPDSAAPLQRELNPPRHSLFSIMVVKESFSFASRIAYGIAVLYLIHRHKLKVPDFYSRISIRNTLSWLFYLTLFYIGLFSIGFLFLFFSPVKGGVIKSSITEASRILPPLLFVFFFTLLAGDQSELIDTLSDETTSENPKPQESKNTGTKYKKSIISEEESVKIYSALNEYLVRNQAFRNPDLTLEFLAEELDVSRHKLSQSINRESGDRFYTLINSLRLSDFISAMEENRYPDYTIIAIAFECGFNSTSSFYGLFKKKTGKTPKEYFSKG